MCKFHNDGLNSYLSIHFIPYIFLPVFIQLCFIGGVVSGTTNTVSEFLPTGSCFFVSELIIIQIKIKCVYD